MSIIIRLRKYNRLTVGRPTLAKHENVSPLGRLLIAEVVSVVLTTESFGDHSLGGSISGWEISSSNCRHAPRLLALHEYIFLDEMITLAR